jgi:hypothetical protein
MRNLMNYLNANVSLGMIFGLVKEDQSVLAFGRIQPAGEKLRMGSITRCTADGDPYWLVLSIDNKNEIRCETMPDVHWFLWKLSACNSWEEAEDWLREPA